MNTIHEVPNGDFDDKKANIDNCVMTSKSLTNDNSTSSSTTKISLKLNTSGNSNGIGDKSSSDAIATDLKVNIANGNSNDNNTENRTQVTEDLKIIGHIKNIEQINEKRRVFLNNTISEFTVDEKTETERETKTVNGNETVISETRSHTREEQGHVGGAPTDSTSTSNNITLAPTVTSIKYATLPKTPNTPPPKPPMLSRTRSIGFGDNRSHSVTAVTQTPTPTSPVTAKSINLDQPTKLAVAIQPTTVISSTQPERSHASPVQLRDETIITQRRIERPMSLSPEAPKQVSVNHYERLIEELKCPGCAYPMKSPIMLCKTGHSICQQCTRVLLLCPLCKEPFTNIRSLTVEALCSKAHFRCSNAAGGCTVRLQIDLLGWHEKQCIYKPMKCFMGRVWGNCDWSGREAHWKEHLEKTHPDKVFHADNAELIWNMSIKQKSLTGYYVFMIYEEMFNFYEVYDKDRILFTMACTSTVKEKKHNYAFEVTIVHQDNEAIAITQKYPVHSEYDNDILAEGTCISMLMSDVAKFIDDDRLVHYRVRIVELKTPRKSRTSSQRNSPNSAIHPTDFQQTQIEGVNLKSVPSDVIVTRKLDEIPYVDNSTTATPKSDGAQSVDGVSEIEGDKKLTKIYNGKFCSHDSGSDSDPEFEAFIAKKWGTPQLHFNRKFLKTSSNDSTTTDETISNRKVDKKYSLPDDKVSLSSVSTNYKKRMSNTLRKSFRGFKTPQLFTKKTKSTE